MFLVRYFDGTNNHIAVASFNEVKILEERYFHVSYEPINKEDETEDVSSET